MGCGMTVAVRFRDNAFASAVILLTGGAIAPAY